VPDRQPVEAGERLEPGEAREQQQLEQCRIRGEQARDPGEAREDVAGAVDVRDVAAVRPQPDDHGRVPRHDHREDREGDQPPNRPRAGEGGGARPVEDEAGVGHA
jgi:hypothetical protein